MSRSTLTVLGIFLAALIVLMKETVTTSRYQSQFGASEKRVAITATTMRAARHSSTRRLNGTDLSCEQKLQLLREERWNSSSAGNYTLVHGRLLREESKLLHQCGMDAFTPGGSKNQTIVLSGVVNESTLFPYPLHLITYANAALENTRERLVLQSLLSGWFRSARGYRETDLPQQFRTQHQEILSKPAGGGFWLWKYPIWELALDRIPIGDYIIYTDAGSNLYASGRSTLIQQIEQMKESNAEFLVYNVRAVMNTTTYERTWEAFGVAANDTRVRSDSLKHGAAMYARNGPELREWLGRIYEALAIDPWIVTDRYNNDTEKNWIWFNTAAYDQSLTTVALALLHTSVVLLPNNRLRSSKGRKLRNPIIAQRERNTATWYLEKLREQLRQQFNQSLDALVDMSDGVYS